MSRVMHSMLAAALLAMVFFLPASAQDTQSKMGVNMPTFADCDLDGDGIITEDEFTKARSERIAKRAQEGRQIKNLANAPSFGDIDVDDNGGIDPDEFAAHQAEHRMKRSQR